MTAINMQISERQPSSILPATIAVIADVRAIIPKPIMADKLIIFIYFMFAVITTMSKY